MKWFLYFICYCSLPCIQGVYYSSTHHKNDRMNWVDKLRIMNISQEAIIEARLKMQQVNDIREFHSMSIAFDVGLIMGNIRERYRRMLETYREYRDKHSKRSVFFPPGIDYYFQPIYYIMAMENLHTIEVDIDKLIHVLEVMDHEKLNPDPRYEGLTTTRRRISWLREGDTKIIEAMAAEQELKSKVREAHLMRRLGLNQHTKSKRFQHQWPVDKNWDLGAYGDMGLYGH